MDECETVSVRVQNPRTHIRQTWWSNCYTDYEIAISSDSIAFEKQASRVRRRYSDFVWLHKQLSKHGSITTKQPVLPKRKVFGRFNHQFLEGRRRELEQYLVSVLQITSFLSDAALHLFLQTDLSVKEMDNVLSGQDSRNIMDIVNPEKKTIHQDKIFSPASTRDSGYSGSIHDETTEDTKDTGWPSMYAINRANCQIMGNGWSSGCTTCTSPTSSSESASSKSSRYSRRLVEPTRAAAVLPGGQLVIPNVLPQKDIVERWLNSDSQSQHNGDKSFRSTERENYDADNETDSAQSDYDIIPENRGLRVREWLNSAVCAQNYDQCDSIDEEVEYSPSGLCLPEYDVISVPCSKGNLLPRCRTPQNTVHPSNEESESNESCGGNNDSCDDDNYSCFSVLHSSIDGIDFQDRDELSVSLNSVCSANLFRTYDVIEMIELKYLNCRVV